MPRSRTKLKIANDFVRDSEGYYSATVADFDGLVVTNPCGGIAWAGWIVLIDCDGEKRPIRGQLLVDCVLSPRQYVGKNGPEYNTLSTFCLKLGALSELELKLGFGKFNSFVMDDLIGKRFRFKLNRRKEVDINSIELI